jgi:FAD/FMN-containing dehydrogenase
VVGLAGLTLGGGYGLLNGEHGLALDNLLDARVVLATGEEVSAGPDTDPDLFWALRGGGGNFGIVTSARYQLHPVPGLLAGLMLFPVSRARDVLREYAEAVSTAPDALTVMAGFFSGPDGQPLLFLLPAWNGNEASGQRAMAQLGRIAQPLSSDIGRRTYQDVLGLFDDMVVDGRHNEMRTRWLPALTEDAAEVLAAAASALTSPFSAIVIHHFHGAAARVPAADTAFALRTDHLLVEVLASWDAREPDGGVHRNWARALSADLERFSLPGGYANLLGSDEHARAMESYGGNLARLREIKRRFDPDSIFHALPDLGRG